MGAFPYVLEPYKGIKSRYTCPNCGKLRQFTRYIDTETGEHIADHVGMCNRASNCAYHYPPSAYFNDNPTAKRLPELSVKRFTVPTQNASPDLIPLEMAEKTLGTEFYTQNNFVMFLQSRFGNALTEKACKRFYIGTSKHWRGATIFWQVDQEGKIRTGKIMLYGAETGKRVRTPWPHVTWVHSELIKRKTLLTFNLVQCLFGLHQILSSGVREVVIVEAPKTAVIASIYLPGFTWMACGALNMLSCKMLEPVKRFPIILYPDLKAWNKWEAKASELRNNGFQIRVSPLLEEARSVSDSDRDDGLDLADYLLKFDRPKTDIERLIDRYPNLSELISRFELEIV